MAAKKQSVEELVQQLKQQGIHYVQFLFTDLNGRMGSMEEALDNLPKFSRFGVGVDGSSIAGFTQVNKSDVRLMPDMDTFAVYNLGQELIARVICDVTFEGKAHPGCARSAFKRVLAQCREMGYEPHMFGELEWYFLNERDRSPHDRAGYCALPPEDKAMAIRHQLGKNLEQAGCLVKRIHHENGPGQNEVELKLAPALKNADDLVTSISIVKMHAALNGLVAEFSPKPLDGEAGSGYHQHNALYDVKTGVNVFGGEEVGTLSEKGLQYTAGMLTHAPEITALFARHKQSFERLKPGHEAPGVAAWGRANRTALIRIPDITDRQDTRIEYRGGDASGSTYLMCAAILGAGLDGIRNGLKCPAETTVNVDLLDHQQLAARGLSRLPADRESAVRVLSSSTWLRSVFGDHIVDFLAKNW
jgi:glutamine synthetase